MTLAVKCAVLYRAEAFLPVMGANWSSPPFRDFACSSPGRNVAEMPRRLNITRVRPSVLLPCPSSEDRPCGRSPSGLMGPLHSRLRTSLTQQVTHMDRLSA